MTLEYFTRTGQDTPAFSGRLSIQYDNLPPARVYVHESAGDGDELGSCASRGVTSVNSNKTLLSGADFLLVAVWRDGCDDMVDLFKFGDSEGWPGNPGMKAYVLRNGVYRLDEQFHTCGDMLIVIGEEEKYRRSTPSLEAYLASPPMIAGLEASATHPPQQ